MRIVLISILILFVNITYGQIIGDQDKLIRATDSLIVDVDFMKSADTVIQLTDLTYHEFSVDSVNWTKHPNDSVKWLRISSDAKNTWKVINLEGTEQYWLNDGSYIYNNSDYGNNVHINTSLVDTTFDLNVGGDVNTEGYYFIGKDSLTHTTIYNGGDGEDGWVLVYQSDTAIWQPAASGQGETNLMQNVNTRGVGVYDNKRDSIFEMRGVASLTDLLTVSLAAGDSTIDLDLVLKDVIAGTGLLGGGDMENDITLNFNIPTGFPTSPSGTIDNLEDWIVIYDTDSATHYKVHPTGLGSSGSAIDLYTNNILRESDIALLNIVEGDRIDIEYTSPGVVTISATTSIPKYTHLPDAYIAYGNSLYSYDISEGTAMLLPKAPTASWNHNSSYAEGDYIWTTEGTTLYRYDIQADTTTAYTAGDETIEWLVGASDGLYAFSNSEAYFINKTSASPTPTFYGNTVTNSTDIIAAKSVVDGYEYLILYNDVTDRQYYKRIRTEHTGFDADTWTAGACSLGSDKHMSFAAANGIGYYWTFDANNVTKVFKGTNYLTTGSCLTYRSDYKTYRVPSGHSFTEGDPDAILTLEASDAYPLSATPTAYALASTVSSTNYTQANQDMGIYVSRSSSLEYSADYTYEIAVGGVMVNDMHVEYIQDGLNYTTNVLVGGEGYTYFHGADKDAKQFVATNAFIVNNALTHPTDIEGSISFVYFDSNYTADGNDPVSPTLTSYLDLQVDSLLKEEDVSKLNFITGKGIDIQYVGDAGIQFISTDSLWEQSPWYVNIDGTYSTTIAGDTLDFVGGDNITLGYSSNAITVNASLCDYSTQTLTSGTDTLSVENGTSGALDIGSNTTIRIEPTTQCNTGNITVTTDASGYTIQFLGDYPVKVTPVLSSTAGVITTTATAGAVDVYSYWFDGTRIIINGTQNYD